ncbi:hypothetical protein FKP32DRAFT_1592041 [Trametes sanguinea]|nr:hypothetical protein FKP32DRAFT_1592041 [Trametes sanguinea]
MSSSADEVAEIIAFYESVFVNTCCPIAVLAFLTYEYLITFDCEVGLFWRSKFTGASALFLTNRYWPLLVQVLNIASSARMSDKSCDAYVNALQTIELLQYFPWAAFSALRTFALSRGNWAISTFVFLLSMVPLGVNFSQYHWLVVVNDPTIGCSKSSTISEEMAKTVTIASRTCLMAADVIVLLVTWMSTFGTIRLTDVALKGRPSFVRLLVRDGTIYFTVLLILNTLHLTFTMLSITDDALSPVSYFTTFTEPITAVLVSRFLLNLQEVNQYNQRSSLSTVTLTQSVTLDFASRVVGSLGSSLEADDESARMSSDVPPSYLDEDMMWDMSDLSPHDRGDMQYEPREVGVGV